MYAIFGLSVEALKVLKGTPNFITRSNSSRIDKVAVSKIIGAGDTRRTAGTMSNSGLNLLQVKNK